jgi:biopolymer transport protein ExbD
VTLTRYVLVAAFAVAACAVRSSVEAPVVVTPSPTAPAASFVHAMPIDLPRAGEFNLMTVIMVVEMHVNGDVFIDGMKVGSDAEFLESARRAHEKNPDVRAAVKADQALAYGKVIHVLDLLKQGGIAKIAFAVAPPF